jgi:hypothetical protein
VQVSTATATAAAAAATPVVNETTANILEQLEEEEARRLEQLEQDHLAADAEVKGDETTPWLNATRWPEQFAQLPIDIIARSALQPVPVAVAAAAPRAINYYLGSCKGAYFISPARDED